MRSKSLTSRPGKSSMAASRRAPLSSYAPTGQKPFAQQRNREHRAKASSFLGLTPCVFRISQNIGDLDSPTIQQSPPHHGPTACFNRNALKVVIGVSADAIARRVVIRAGVPLTQNRGHLRLTMSRRRHRQCVEHRLEIETRAANGGCERLSRRARCARRQNLGPTESDAFACTACARANSRRR